MFIAYYFRDNFTLHSAFKTISPVHKQNNEDGLWEKLSTKKRFGWYFRDTLTLPSAFKTVSLVHKEINED